MFKIKLKAAATPIVAIVAIVIASSFTQSEETTSEKKVDINCPWPSTKTIKGCVQGFSSCTPEGTC